MAASAPSLYDKVVRVTYVYLGPAADRFVSRQISNHLNKRPDQLKSGDLPELVNWIRVSMGFLTEDEKLIDDYIKRLEALEGKHKRESTRHAFETS